MRRAAKIRRTIGNLFGRQRLESTLDAELRAYLDEMTGRKIRDGISPAEARREALLEAGGLEQLKEEVRSAWLGNGIETAVRDARYAVRSLLRSPGFTSVVVLTLALGIGTNLTMFSVMHAVLWRPLPYPAPGRIVLVQVDARNVANAGAAPGELLDLKARSRMLEDLSMISVVDANLDYGGEMEHLTAASVSDDFLPALGVRPTLGRPLNSHIDDVVQARNVLISDALWRRRFGAGPAVIGRAVYINNLDIRIAGVLPPDFRLFLPPWANAAESIDIWFSTGIGRGRQYRWFPIAARLTPGATLVQANAELQTIAAQFVREHPEAYPDGKLRLTAVRLHDEMTRGPRPALFLLAGAVGFVLLIACVNVANLMLAHGAARQRELAIRRALGAGSVRIVRQLLTESLILALFAGAAGLALAAVGLDAIAKLGNVHLPLQSRIAVDGTVALFALGLSVATSLLFGLLPAWRLASGRMSDPLRAGLSQSASTGMRKLQRALVIAEVALSIVPLASGGLMLRTFVNLARAPLGFDPTHVLTARLPMNFRLYSQTPQRWAVLREILGRVAAIPGVEAVSAAGPLPMAPGQITMRVGRVDRPGVPGIVATQQTALNGYLKLVGTPLLQGRDFTPEDVAAARPVVIVDEHLARRLWPEGALGRHLAIEHTGGTREDLEVIGVTAPVRATSVRDESVAHFVVPYHLYPLEMTLVAKTRQTAAGLAPAIQSAVAAAHTTRAAFDIRPMADYVTESIGNARFTTWVLAVFAAASILLAAVGLYGTLAYLIAQRTREFGIRLALGSTVRAIVAMVLREGALLAAAGVALGLAGAAAVTGAIRQLLYNVSPFDGVTLLGVVGLVALVAIAAAGVPAWRATRIEPVAAMRSE
jgi:predicted permease